MYLLFFYLYLCNKKNFFFFFSSRRRHTRFSRDWSSDVCSSDLGDGVVRALQVHDHRDPLAELLAQVAGLVEALGLGLVDRRRGVGAGLRDGPDDAVAGLGPGRHGYRLAGAAEAPRMGGGGV